MEMTRAIALTLLALGVILMLAGWAQRTVVEQRVRMLRFTPGARTAAIRLWAERRHGLRLERLGILMVFAVVVIAWASA